MARVWDKVANLFGVGHRDETDSLAIKHQCAWQERRLRLLNRRCGQLAKGHDLQQQPDLPPSGRRDGPGHSRPRRQQTSSANKPPPPPPSSMLVRAGRVGSESKIATTIDTHRLTLNSTTATSEDFYNNQRPGSDRSIGWKIPTVDGHDSHAPQTLIRTNSDTAIQNTTGEPQYPHLHHSKHTEFEDNLSQKSFYDLTDFDAKESIVKLVNDVITRHEPKRAFGMGLVGNLLSRKFRKDLTNAQLKTIYSFNDHRPYFTYWVTTVQILIMIITLFTYGFGPFALSKTLVKGTVYVSSLTYHTEAYYEKENIWLGPRSSDLIHLGAKFTPCMRRDSLIYNEINKDRQDERSTGCCIRNDKSGCLQTTKDACSSHAKWHSWNETSTLVAPKMATNQRHRTSGPVCGQDPQYCLRPASSHPHEWPDDISKWPICHERLETTQASHHMSCEVVGRPCCVGIYGQCRITHSDHCQFLRGTFHPEATLCSQVSCMEDVCGMVPFYARDYPDQFYRLITALFLHAGLLHLSFTVILQYYIMRDIERLLGSTRMAIIYILPGVAGYLASATFVPYHTQVGPSGSQFALLACLIAELINSWKILDDPLGSLWKLLSIALGLFILGLLPWIDNYAHIFGFIVGLMLSLALTPYLTPFNDHYNRRKKVIQNWVCILLVMLTFVLLPLPLYIFPLYKCSWCQYLDCLPLTSNWCENQDIRVTRLDIF